MANWNAYWNQRLKVGISGVDEFNRSIEKITKSVGADKVEPVLLSGAQILAQKEKDYAPLGPTGNLKRGFHASLLRRIDGMPAAGAGPDYRINPHTHLLEYGTVRMPAHPIIRPAWDSTKDTIKQFIKDGFKKLIEDAV